MGGLQEGEGVSDTSFDAGAHRVTAEETPGPPQLQLGVCLAPFTQCNIHGRGLMSPASVSHGAIGHNANTNVEAIEPLTGKCTSQPTKHPYPRKVWLFNPSTGHPLEQQEEDWKLVPMCRQQSRRGLGN